MESIALSVMFAGALFVPATFASGMATPATSQTAAPSTTQDLPQKVTRSGHEFLAHCNSEAFASARFPQKLAARCTRILSLWRAEADRKGNRMERPQAASTASVRHAAFRYRRRSAADPQRFPARCRRQCDPGTRGERRRHMRRV